MSGLRPLLVRRRGALGLWLARTVALDDVDGFAVAGDERRGFFVTCTVRGADLVDIGKGLRHTREAAEWLARRLERAVRNGRALQPDRRLKP